MSNVAKSIETLATNKSNDQEYALELAERHAIAKDQDWEKEITEYIFDDNSVLVFNNMNFYAKQTDA